MRKSLLLLFLLFPLSASADKIILKDGTVYTGKILIDTDKAVLIGNPPYETTSYLIKAEDIQTIVYEEYHPAPPAQRRRGLVLDTQLQGNAFSSSQLPLHAAPGLSGNAGFRLHPFFEIDGGLDWIPNVTSGSGLSISDGTNTRGYQDFWFYSGNVIGRIYPLAQKKKIKTEPYLFGGYSWDHLVPKDSGDSLSGQGWQIGFGFLRPWTTHLFIDGRFSYQDLSLDHVNFLGTSGSISPAVDEHRFLFSIGLSYRL